jgi:predicted transcriptional regulator of viral defense system
METKNTILSRKDASLLEDTIIRHGRIVTFAKLRQVFGGEYSLAEIRNRVSFLSKQGWLVRIKRGLYLVVTDIGSLSSCDISVFTIAHALNKDSYISFENALQHHGMFDQMLSTVGSVTFKRARRYKTKDAEIRFFKIKRRFYFGFAEEKSDIGLVNIARPEKALLDMLYFRSNAYYANLVWEKLNEYKRKINLDLLKKYAVRFNLDVARQTGFFLDRLGLDSSDLEKTVRGRLGYSRMTKDSGKFSAKWRLYFEPDIVK